VAANRRDDIGGIAIVAVLATCLVGLITSLADWSDIARRDPARALDRSPHGVTELGADATRSGMSVTEYALFVAAGLAFIACGMIAARGKAPGLTAGLLYAAGVVWLLEGLRLSSQPVLFTLGTQMKLLVLPILIHLGLAFPEGRLGSRSARLFVGTLYAYYVIYNVSNWIFFDPQLHVPNGESTSVNLLLISDQPTIYATIRTIHTVIFLLIEIILLGILADRWHKGSPAFRRSLLPLWWAFFLVTVIRLWSTLDSIDLPGTGGWLRYTIRYWAVVLIPIAILIGLARYRLARGAMSRMMVDLGSGPVDHDQLQGLLQHTLHDPTAELWLWSDEGQEYIDLDRRFHGLASVSRPRVVTTLDRGDVRLAALVHDQTLLQQPELLEAVRAGTTLLLENLRLTAALELQLEATQQSRQRIVAAGDAERRRLERDIHDGAQQELVAAALMFRRAGRAADPDQAKAMLVEGSAQLESAITGLRELARGVHPPMLRERGLSAALTSLAERASLPVEIIDHYRQRAPDTVEACLYFSAAEAITNALKYAEATHLTIELAAVDGLLRLRVSDDGRGGAAVEPGGGLAGLQDRVAALGGSLDLESAAEVGTRVTVVLPLPGDGDAR
jgi:signal transduction histidine kinase